MSLGEFLVRGWNFDPFSLCLLSAACLAICGKRRPKPKRLFLLCGWMLAAVALISPLGTLARYDLFSAHMVQHLVLLLVTPALGLIGMPSASCLAGTPPISTPPSPWRTAVSWLSGVGGMWLWHTPTLCNAAGSRSVIFDLEVLSLVMLGGLFWWPVLGPRPRERLWPLAGIVYLFTACLACTALGIYITFTPLTVCAVYTHPTDPFQILGLLRQEWGLTPGTDQQIGGLIMWVPACLIYLSGIVGLLARWFGKHQVSTESESIRSVPHSRSLAPPQAVSGPSL
jgi:putative membrane protein